MRVRTLMKCKLHKAIKVIWKNCKKSRTHTSTHTCTHTYTQRKRKRERKTTLYLCVWIFYVHIGPKLSYNKLKQIFALKNLTHFFSAPAQTNFKYVCVPFVLCTVCCVVCAACKFSLQAYTGMRKSYCFKFCTFFSSLGLVCRPVGPKRRTMRCACRVHMGM